MLWILWVSILLASSIKSLVIIYSSIYSILSFFLSFSFYLSLCLNNSLSIFDLGTDINSTDIPLSEIIDQFVQTIANALIVSKEYLGNYHYNLRYEE